MSRTNNIITIFTCLALMSSIASCLSVTESITGNCLKASLKDLIAAGCNFNPNPEVYRALLKHARSTQNFNFGQATQSEAAALWPTPKFLSGYFGTAISQPNVPVSGEIGAGIQYLGDYVSIGMDNIHLCSDQGEYADYTMTSTKILVKSNFVKKFSKQDLRDAGWQIDCENKNVTYKDLLATNHQVISQE